GVTRMLIGFLTMTDLLRRAVAWEDMYGDQGLLPAQYNLFRPNALGVITVLNAFQTSREIWVLWVVMFATAFCLFIGFKTKLMQVLAFLFVTSMNMRVLLIENGGYVVHNLLMMWTAFLPLGDRFSVDAFLASMKRRRERNEDELNDRTD